MQKNLIVLKISLKYRTIIGVHYKLPIIYNRGVLGGSASGRHLAFLEKALNNLNFLFKFTEQLKINNLKYQTRMRFERIIIFKKERQMSLITIITHAQRFVKICSSFLRSY